MKPLQLTPSLTLLTLAVAASPISAQPADAEGDRQAAIADSIRAAEAEVAQAGRQVEQIVEFNEELPVPPAPRMVTSFDWFFGEGVGGAQGRDRILMLPGAATKPEVLPLIREDLAIMARVLEKAAADTRDRGDRRDLFKPDTMLGGGRELRAMYLEGFGAVFLLDTRMPLLPPAERPVKEAPKDEPDARWEDARRELNGNPGGGMSPDPLRRYGFKGTEHPPEPFDAARVEQLKSRILDALASASNIRNLAEGDFITVEVQGAGNAGGAHAPAKPAPPRPTRPAAKPDAAPRPAAPGMRGPGAGRTSMVFRVRKADVDALAKGKFDAEAFRKKVAVTTTATP